MQEFGSTTEVDVTPPSPVGKLCGVVYGNCFSRMLLLSPLEPLIVGLPWFSRSLGVTVAD